MVMNGFDTNFDRSNEVYAVNTVAFAFMNEPIRVKRGELVRIYLVNMLEFDLVNSFHIHANFFDYYPTGTQLEPRDFTDTVILGQGERGILELRFPYAGKYMFHAHVSEFADLGWMGFFEVDATDGGRGHRHDAAARRPPGSPGSCRSRCSRWRSRLFVALDAPGLERNGVPVEELVGRADGAAPGRDRAARAQRRAGPGRDQAGDRERRLRAFTQTDGRDRPPGRRHESRSTTRGSRARPTRSACSRRPAARSTTSIEVAAETPDADLGFYGLMALIGLYVGVIPVAIGMLWLPWVRRIDPRWSSS